MAQVIIPDIYKDALVTDASFIQQVKYSIIDQAIYVKGQDGTGTYNAASFKQLAQWKPFAAQIVSNSNVIDMSVAPQFFVNQIVKQGLPCWNDQTNLVADAVAWLVSNNHFGANDLAQAWFADKVYQSPW